jgi:thiosulfate/3-mercaptopyruvate sulfurtransferase
VILDTSPESNVEGLTSGCAGSAIPGSRFFDIKNNFSDKSSAYPNTVPTAEQFEQACRKLGINNSSKVIVYDNLGVYSSPRAWWLFKIMGHDDVSVLDGGLPEWISKGFPSTSGRQENLKPGDFKAVFNKEYLKTYDEIMGNLTDPSFLIVDARSEGRFKGVEKEPRAGLKSGHIPKSVNIPYQEVLNAGKFRSAQELQALFNAKCSTEKDLVFSCGSGLTACILALASEISIDGGKVIYDGSWTEWAERQNLKES